MQGDLFKKMKDGTIKSQYHILLGVELYSYWNKNDKRHIEMKSLTGVYLKDLPEA